MAITNNPLTRTEQYLARVANGSGSIPNEPLTRAEMYLSKIATGEGDVPEKPLTRIEKYLAYIAENGSSGESQNTKLTINATMDAPWGELDFADLTRKIYSGDASAKISFSFGGMSIVGLSVTCYSENEMQVMLSEVGSTANDSSAAFVWWYHGELTELNLLTNGAVTDMLPYASSIETTLEVFYHPM